MPHYLLSTECLLDIAHLTNRPPQHWFETSNQRGIDRTQIFISAVTPMILRTTFESQAKKAESADRKAGITTLRTNAEILTNRFVNGGRIVPVTKEIADRWGELLIWELVYKTPDGRDKRFTFPEKLVIATAVVGMDGVPFTLVARRNDAHIALASLGLVVEDPYETS